MNYATLPIGGLFRSGYVNVAIMELKYDNILLYRMIKYKILIVISLYTNNNFLIK